MEDLVLHHLGPQRVQGGQWYGPNVVHAHTVGKDAAVTATLHFSTTGGKNTCTLESAHNVELKTRRLGPLDWQAPVSLWSICFHGGTNTAPFDVMWRTNYTPKGVQKQQEEMDLQMEAYGLPKGAVGIIPAGHAGKFAQAKFALRGAKALCFLNPHWIRTVALLTPQNVMNGVVLVPRDICLQHPALQTRVWQCSKHEPDPPPGAIHHYYAVPPDHVFSYVLRNYTEWDKHPPGSRLPHPIPLSLNDEIICYLVADQELQALREQLLTGWCPLVDRRPLEQLEFQVQAKPGSNNTTGGGAATVTLDISVAFTAWPILPSPEEIQHLAPTFPKMLI